MFTDITAALAIILSVISLVWQWREKRPDLRVSPQIETKPLPIASDGMGGFANVNTVALCIYLTNPGEKPVYVSGVYLKLQKSQTFQLDDFHALYDGLFRPFSIEPLRGYTFNIWGEKLAKLLQENGINGNLKAKIIVRDEVNKQYKSKSLRFSVSQLRDKTVTQKKDVG
jgi:hypothetical protein